KDPSFRAVVLKVFLKATSPYNQISGSAANVLDHLAMGAFYFRKREFEYFLGENEYLLGTDLRSFWDWYFQDVAPPCTFCEEQLHRCSCKHYEDGKPAPVKNPSWWQEVSTRKNLDPRVNIDEWARALLTARGVSRPRVD